MARSTLRSRLKWWALALGVLAVAVVGSAWMMFAMPGSSHDGPLPALTDAQHDLADVLERDVVALAEDIGPRNIHTPESLGRSVDWLLERFGELGYEVERHAYSLTDAHLSEPVTCENLIVEIPGTDAADEIVLFGAHYDSVLGSPGANDNASGVAALLALAQHAAERVDAGDRPTRTLRFVAFVNEEPPYFQTPAMGSYVYAQRSAERGENIVAMVSFDGLGYFDDAAGSQAYPIAWLRLFYPSTGDFIAVVGNVNSRGLVREVVGTFREDAAFPSEGAALPALVPEVGWSDHWAFWEHGYRGVMVTDTLPLRYPHYHGAYDVPDALDFERMARVVEGMKAVMVELARFER